MSDEVTIRLTGEDARTLYNLLTDLRKKPCHYCLAVWEIPRHHAAGAIYEHKPGCALVRILDAAWGGVMSDTPEAREARAYAAFCRAGEAKNKADREYEQARQAWLDARLAEELTKSEQTEGGAQ